MELNIILAILIAHWLADFVFQSDKMAKGKSSSIKWLSYHAISYTGVMLLVWPLAYYYSLERILPWLILNGAAHWVVDYFTSRWGAKLWSRCQIHNFFVVIGLDQLIHVATMMVSWKIML